MVGRDERKAVVLRHLLRIGLVTTRDLVERSAISHSGGQASLEKYRRGSLLTRQRELGPGLLVYRDRLTITGHRKSAWFIGQTLIADRHRPIDIHREVQSNHRGVTRPKSALRVMRPLIHLTLSEGQLEEKPQPKRSDREHTGGESSASNPLNRRGTMVVVITSKV